MRIDCNLGIAENCERQLKKPGGLMFSPPRETTTPTVWKDHVCQPCWSVLRALVSQHVRRFDMRP